MSMLFHAFRHRFACAAFAVVVALPLAAQPAPTLGTPADSEAMAGRVRAEYLHAWQGYHTYAWGHDALMPLSKKPHDWYGVSLHMTEIDGLDTMILMGLDKEAAEAQQDIDKHLSFDQDIYVKNFEITIRCLGGLLSEYEATNDPQLLKLATDLGNRLLPAFHSPTGMPYEFVNLRTGKVRGAVTNPAEVALLPEFGTLSKLTGNPVYYNAAKRAMTELWKRRSSLDLVGLGINVETGEWTDSTSSISGGIDSFDEYLLKSWLLFGDRDCLEMWQKSIVAINTYLARADAVSACGTDRLTCAPARAPRTSMARSMRSFPRCSRWAATCPARRRCSAPASRCGRFTASSQTRLTTSGLPHPMPATRCGRRLSSPRTTCTT